MFKKLHLSSYSSVRSQLNTQGDRPYSIRNILFGNTNTVVNTNIVFISFTAHPINVGIVINLNKPSVVPISLIVNTPS